MKFRAKIDYDICPTVVRKQHAAFCEIRGVTTKSFSGTTVEKCLKDRRDWIISNKEAIVVPKKETFDSYVCSLNKYLEDSSAKLKCVSRYKSKTTVFHLEKNKCFV